MIFCQNKKPKKCQKSLKFPIKGGKVEKMRFCIILCISVVMTNIMMAASLPAGNSSDTSSPKYAAKSNSSSSPSIENIVPDFVDGWKNFADEVGTQFDIFIRDISPPWHSTGGN